MVDVMSTMMLMMLMLVMIFMVMVAVVLLKETAMLANRSSGFKAINRGLLSFL